MVDLEKIESDWRIEQGKNANLVMKGRYVSEVSEEWRKALTFKQFMGQNYNLSIEEKVLLFGEGKAQPRTSANALFRYKHPQGYHFFRKSCSVAVEEYMLSHFAAACNFPYAPVLLGEHAEIYTPKLGNSLLSLYELLIQKLSIGDVDDISPDLQTAFKKAVQRYGAANKIPYQQLTIDEFSSEKLVDEWSAPIFEKNKVFMAKMAALMCFSGAAEKLKNPSNIICNKSGRFIYGIDFDPGGYDFRIDQPLRPRDKCARPLYMHSFFDVDIIENMQKIMQETISDDLIDTLVDRAGVAYISRHELLDVGDLGYVDGILKNIPLIKDSFKFRRDNPPPILDPQTNRPI